MDTGLTEWVWVVPPGYVPRNRDVLYYMLRKSRRQDGTLIEYPPPLGEEIQSRVAAFEDHSPEAEPYSNCVHMKEKLEDRMCVGCPSSRRVIAVHACALHGKCARRPVATERNTIDRSIAVCVGCGDYATGPPA